jgi:hypothetical protein
MSLAAVVGVSPYGFAGVSPVKGVPTPAPVTRESVKYVYNGVILLLPIASCWFIGTIDDVSVKVDDMGRVPTRAFTTIGAVRTSCAGALNIPPMIPVEGPIVRPYDGGVREYDVTGTPE